MRITLILAAALALAGGAEAAAPQVRVVSESPVQVSGTGFHRGERVTVRVHVSTGAAASRTVVATSTGKIAVRFATLTIDPCDTYSVTALGKSGSRAAKKVTIPPACGIVLSP